MSTVNVTFGQDLAAVLQALNRPIEESARELIVLELYREGKISSGKAAELLDVDRTEFLRMSSGRGIPFLAMTAEELAQDVDTAEELMRTRSGDRR